MQQKYPVITLNNVGRISNMRMQPGPVRKSGILMEEGYSATPRVRWEHRIDNGYPNVFYDDLAGEYRCYYTAFITDISSTVDTPANRVGKTYDFSRRDLYPPRVAGILLATSKDGLAWTRPELGIVQYDGDTRNNIVMTDVHGASVFLDHHETNPQRRYKMMTRHDAHEAMAVSFSPDGIHWEAPTDWPDYNPAGDTHNFAFWDDAIGKYVLITRTWDFDSIRLAARCESDDFIHWSRPVEIYRGIGLDDQIYSMPVFPYEGMYLGLASMFHGGDRAAKDFDCVDCELTISGDGFHWDRPAFGQPFIPRGEGVYGSGVPDACCIYASAPVRRGDDLQFYYFGGTGQHTNFRESHLMCATVSADKLAGYVAQGEGFMETKPLRITGDALYAIADVEAGGEIAASIGLPGRTFYEDARPLQGFTTADCTATQGEDGRWYFTFKGGPLSTLDGYDEFLVVTFHLKNAVLYGYGGDVQVRRRHIDRKV